MFNWTDKNGDFYVIWPSHRKLTADQVIMAYQDGVDNGDCEPGYDDDPIAAAKDLSSAGLFTFANSF